MGTISVEADLCITMSAERERSLGSVLQSGQQQPLIQLFAQSLRLIKLHALQMLPVRIRLRRIERGLAQFQNLGDLEFTLEPIQGSQQVALLGGEVAAQRVFGEQSGIA